MDQNSASCTICAGAESPGFYTGCIIKDGMAPSDCDWRCDGKGNLFKLPDDVVEILKGCVVEPCGSRVTCNPPPVGTDRDFLVQVQDDDGSVRDVANGLLEIGFTWEGAQHYQDAANAFMSHRRDDINLIVTRNGDFAMRHRAATHVCKRLNLPNKEDRIALFQAVLYGTQYEPKGSNEHVCPCGAGDEPCPGSDGKPLCCKESVS